LGARAERDRTVCIITHSAYPVEPRCRRMAEALVERGYTVDVLCLRLSGQPAEESLNGVQVRRLPVTRHQGAGAGVYIREYGQFFLLAAAELVRMHRQRGYALVQVHNPPDALVFCTLPLKLAGIPIILDLRELTPELFMSRFHWPRNSFAVRVLTILERLACAYASSVLVLHERHRQIMLTRNVPAEKLVQVMNCPDERLFDPTALLQAGRDGKAFVVINHGGMMERYGVDLLVRAVAGVRDQIPDIRLELYGTGDFRPYLEQLVRDLALTDRVRFHGQQPLEQMPAAIALADVGVTPMRQDVFTDCGLPTKLLEYVALKVPAIASRTATTADYFDDSMVYFFRPGDTGDLADKLLAVYRDPSGAAERASRARHFTDIHNWSTESANYMALVSRLTI
jgi:glycosyltransferase involved in cell wall biosynthesis